MFRLLTLIYIFTPPLVFTTPDYVSKKLVFQPNITNLHQPFTRHVAKPEHHDVIKSREIRESGTKILHDLKYRGVAIPMSTRQENRNWKADVFQLYSIFCGRVAFCDIQHYNESAYAESSGIYCPPCSCDVDCGYYDNCCVDIALETPDGSHMTSCLTANPKPPPVHGRIATLFMFSKCPLDYENVTVREKCEDSMWTNNSTMTSNELTQLPVTSSRNNRTYVNENCAKCHGMTSADYVHWSADFQCIYDLSRFDSENFNKNKDHDIETCYFTHLKPPETQNLRRCNTGKITKTCQHNPDYSNDINVFLSQMCAKFTSPVESRSIYGNVFCAVCNADDISGVEIVWGPDMIFVPPLVALFSPILTDKKPHNGTETPKCNGTEIYDVFTRYCRRVECHWGRTYTNGTCVRIVNGEKRFKYIMEYTIQLMEFGAYIRALFIGPATENDDVKGKMSGDERNRRSARESSTNDKSFNWRSQRGLSASGRKFNRRSQRKLSASDRPFNRRSQREVLESDRSFNRQSRRDISANDRSFNRQSRRDISANDRSFNRQSRRDISANDRSFNRSSQRDLSTSDRSFNRRSRRELSTSDRSFNRQSQSELSAIDRSFNRRSQRELSIKNTVEYHREPKHDPPKLVTPIKRSRKYRSTSREHGMYDVSSVNASGVFVNSLMEITKQHFDHVWGIIRGINGVNTTKWDVEISGNVVGGSYGFRVRKLLVFQDVIVLQNQKIVNENEKLLLSTLSRGMFVYFDTSFVVFKPGKMSRGATSVKRRVRPAIKVGENTIKLTADMGCPFVRYGFDNVKFNVSSITMVNNFIYRIENRDYRARNNRLVELCMDVIQKLNIGLENGSFVIKNFTYGNITNYWIKIVKQTLSVNDPKTVFIQGVLTTICCSLSIIALLLTFVTYCLFSELRTAPGYNTMSLVIHLFVSQLLFLTAMRRYDDESDAVCALFGVVVHYTWLCTFSWMSVCAFHMHSVFTKFRPPQWTLIRFIKYVIAANGIPVLVVSSCIVYHVSKEPHDSIGYGGPLLCYITQNRDVMLVFIVAPVAAMLLANTVFFTRTVYYIQKIAVNASATLSKADQNHVQVYFKLSLLLGFTWSLGFVQYIVVSDVVSYLFIVANGCQGLFIFIAYCCNRRIVNSYWKMCRRGRQMTHRETLTSTTKSSNISNVTSSSV